MSMLANPFHWLVAAAALAALPVPVAAQSTYPSRPVKVIVPYAPGGTVDIFQRKIAEKFAEKLGQPFVVDNRPGANGVIGVEAAARSAPDGHTLLATSIVSQTKLFNRNMSIDVLKDLEPIGLTNVSYLYLYTAANLPFKTLGEFLAYAKANPGKLAYGSAIVSGHVAIEMLKNLAGVDILHVPYKGVVASRNALLAGEVQLIVDTGTGYRGFIDANKIRGLVVGTNTRTALLPEVPSAAEAGFPNWQAGSAGNMWAPAGTSKEIVARLNRALQEILALQDVRDMITAAGSQPRPSSPEELRRYIHEQLEYWTEAIRIAKYVP